MIARRAALPGSAGGDMTDAQAAALVTAGRLLQARGWPGGSVRIQAAPGETYPDAVARVVASLDPGERDRLRSLVVWVLNYEQACV